MAESPATPDVVIAHDFAETFGGAERVLAEMAAAFPHAPVWAIAGRRSVAARMGVAERFHTLLPERSWLLERYRSFAPAYPSLVRARRLPEAEVLLTSSYAYAHGMRTVDSAPQACFCHSPLRFAWSMTGDYGRRLAGTPLRGAAFAALVRAARRADRRASRRVDRYLAGSEHVAGHIHRAYGREAELLRIPIDCSTFRYDPAIEPSDRDFLFFGRLVEPYKRPGLVVQAFRGRPERLIVAGDGPAYAELREQAGPNVEFTGTLTDDQLVPLIQRAAGVIFPSHDDFGMVPVEAMACGRPVIAYAGGGALESVVEGATGTFFEEPSEAALGAALDRFRPGDYRPAEIRRHAEQWDSASFREGLRRIAAELAVSRR